MTINALIALGSNQPIDEKSPESVLLSAIARLSDSGLKIRKQSHLFSTPCFPAGAGPDFVNATISINTGISAPDLIAVLHHVEAEFGRERKGRWAPRGLDLDLIAFGSAVHPDQKTQKYWQSLPLERQKTDAPEELILPHPRMQDRAFVLVPLAEIAPDWVHPVLGLSVTQMLDALPEAEKKAITPL